MRVGRSTKSAREPLNQEQHDKYGHSQKEGSNELEAIFAFDVGVVIDRLREIENLIIDVLKKKK